MWAGFVGPRFRAAASSDLGIARDQDGCHLVPIVIGGNARADTDPLARRFRRRAARLGRAATGGVRRTADGLLPSEQTPRGASLATILGQPCSTGLTVKLQNA